MRNPQVQKSFLFKLCEAIKSWSSETSVCPHMRIKGSWKLDSPDLAVLWISGRIPGTG